MDIWIANSFMRITKVHDGAHMDIKMVAYAGACRRLGFDPINEGRNVVERFGNEGE